jgi:hypothetical protein
LLSWTMDQTLRLEQNVFWKKITSLTYLDVQRGAGHGDRARGMED